MLLDLWEQDLRSLVEIRCGRHGHDVHAPSFSVVLTSLAILEAVLMIFEWDPSARKVTSLCLAGSKSGRNSVTTTQGVCGTGIETASPHLFYPKQHSRDLP